MVLIANENSPQTHSEESFDLFVIPVSIVLAYTTKKNLLIILFTMKTIARLKVLAKRLESLYVRFGFCISTVKFIYGFIEITKFLVGIIG